MLTIKQDLNNKRTNVKTKQLYQQHKSKQLKELNQKNAKLISTDLIMLKSNQLSDEFLCFNKELEFYIGDVLNTLKKEDNQLSSISLFTQTQLEDMSIVELVEYQTNLFQKLEQVQESLKEFIEKQSSFKKFLNMNLKKIKSQVINKNNVNNKRNKKIQQKIQTQVQDSLDDDDQTADCLCNQAQDYEKEKQIKLNDLRYFIKRYTTDINLQIQCILGQCLINNVLQSKSEISEDKLESDSLIKSVNTQINNMMTLGYQLKQNSQYKKAIIIYDQILQKEPDNAKSLYEKGDCLRMLNQYSDALILIEQALEIEPLNISFLWSKCCCLGLQSQYQEALLTIEKAIQLDLSQLQFYWAKGECLRLLGESSQSIELFDYVLSMDSQNIFSLCSKGECLRNLGKYQESLEILDKSIEKNPTYYFSLGCKGLLYQNQFKYEDAIIYLQESIKYNPHELCFKQALDYCQQMIQQKQIY